MKRNWMFFLCVLAALEARAEVLIARAPDSTEVLSKHSVEMAYWEFSTSTETEITIEGGSVVAAELLRPSQVKTSLERGVFRVLVDNLPPNGRAEVLSLISSDTGAQVVVRIRVYSPELRFAVMASRTNQQPLRVGGKVELAPYTVDVYGMERKENALFQSLQGPSVGLDGVLDTSSLAWGALMVLRTFEPNLERSETILVAHEQCQVICEYYPDGVLKAAQVRDDRGRTLAEWRYYGEGIARGLEVFYPSGRTQHKEVYFPNGRLKSLLNLDSRGQVILEELYSSKGEPLYRGSGKAVFYDHRIDLSKQD